MIKTAVIMAAGMGSRFGQYTESIPKGFIECGGISMIERSVKVLISCGIERIIIGTGYLKEKYEALAKFFPQIECVFSSRYAETNSMYTLYNCRQMIGDADFLLLESDLIFEKKAITSLLECRVSDVMLVTPVTKFQDQYYVEANDQNILVNCSVNKDTVQAMGELVGIHKISNKFYQLMCKDYEEVVNDKPKLGYEYELLSMSQHISPVYVLCVPGLFWYEIDDVKDLKYAERHVLSKINAEK